MKKGKVKYWLKNLDIVIEFNGNCIYHEDRNVITYKEDDGTNVFFDLNSNLLSRENQEIKLVLDFKGIDSYIKMKKMNKELSLALDVLKVRKEKNTFKVEYSLNKDDNVEFFIQWFVEGE